MPSERRYWKRLCRPSRWGVATIQTRSPMNGNPTSRPRSTRHSASYPMAASDPRTRSIPRASNSATFSMMMTRGRISPTKRAYSRHNPLRSPSSPLPLTLAIETSWHGNPPQIASTSMPSRRRSSAVRVRTSLYCLTPGQCLARTALQYGSISQKATVSNPPDRSRPRLKPSDARKKIKHFKLAHRHPSHCL